MSFFTWIARPTQCKFGGHDLMKSIERPTNMICRHCRYIGDDVQDFISTDEPGVRLCPSCGSSECYITQDRAILLTICTRCDYKSAGVEIKLKDGVVAFTPKAKVVDPYAVNHQIYHEVVKWCEHCENTRIVLPHIQRCVYCKGELVV